ncbi:MAG: hypothetical protein ABSH53_14190 [Holophaga sp.]
MKRQTLFLAPVLLVALVVSLVTGYQALRPLLALRRADAWRPASVLGLTLDLPADLSAPTSEAGDPWTVMAFRTGVLGSLRIGREQPRGDIRPALQDWFGLPGPLEGPVTYRFRGQPAQARPVTAFGPAGHWIHRQGRQLAAVCVFDLGGSRYWIQSQTSGASPATLACFHHLLLSLRGPGGAPVAPALTGELKAAEAGLAPGLVQPQAWLALIPVAVVALLILVVVSYVNRLSGRPPKVPAGVASRYSEVSVEVLLASQFQRKFFDAALEVLKDRLVIHTFGTPFLEVTLAALRGRVTEKTGWFGPPFLELRPEGGLDYRKLTRVYVGLTSKTWLRIYTRDHKRLRAALGG